MCFRESQSLRDENADRCWIYSDQYEWWDVYLAAGWFAGPERCLSVKLYICKYKASANKIAEALLIHKKEILFIYYG